MKFSIITPSFNQLDYLKRCVASVADQVTVGKAHSAGRIEIHHHVQDACSTDGTVNWLECYAHDLKGCSLDTRHSPPDTSLYTFSYSSERDAGMYDALNKGIAFVAGGQRSEDRSPRRMEPPVDKNSPNNHSLIINNCDDTVVAWLNCDEQYLPGTFGKVARYFSEHPEKDLVCGDALLVAPDGRLITYRKNPPLRKTYILADHLYAQSAALFFRAGVFTSGLQFDPSWKAVGDCDWVVRALRSGFHPGQIRDYLAVCTMTGKNLSRQRTGVEELRAFRQTASWVYRIGRPVWNLSRCLEKLLRGGYHQSVPLEYELYPENSNVRKKFVVQNADFRFRWDAHE